MPVNNALAESINTGQSEDPFKRVLEYGQIGLQGTRNRLMEAQIGEAGARAGEAGAGAALARAHMNQVNTMTPLQAANEKARTGTSLAEQEKIRVSTAAARAENGGRIGNAILSGATPDEVDSLAQSYGEPPMPPAVKQQYKDNPALYASHGRNLVAFGSNAATGMGVHPLQPGGGYVTQAEVLRNAVPPTQPNSLATTPPSVPIPAAAPGTPPTAPQAAAPLLSKPPMTPEQKAETAGLGGLAAKDYEASTKSYNGALDLKGRLAIIDHNIDSLGPQWMGAGADAKAQLGKTWNSALDTLGVEGFHINPEKIATWEDFNKETTRAGMELIKSNFGGSREAASIIQMGRTAVPAVQNTYLGAKYVSATISAAAQRQIDLHEFKTELVKNGQSLVGADVAFNKTHPAEDYARGAIAGVIPKTSVAKLLAGGPTDSFDTHYGPGMAQYILSHRPQ